MILMRTGWTFPSVGGHDLVPCFLHLGSGLATQHLWPNRVGQLWVLGSEPQSHLQNWLLSQCYYSLNTCTVSPVFVFLLTGTANKSNVVTASTSVQLLDGRRSPVVAGKQWISIDEYKVSMASTYRASQLLLCTGKLVLEGKNNLITPSATWRHLLQSQGLAAGCIWYENRNFSQDFCSSTLSQEEIVGVCRRVFLDSR